MSVAQILRVVEIVRSFGVPVTFEAGWDTRGNGQSSAYQGGVIHHTGGSYANSCPGILIYGRSDLAGPLCNFAGLTGGGLHVVAAHPANHAGASGGPLLGPFPVTGLFNRLVMGLEICYPGGQPMTAAQYRTAKVFAKAMQIMYGNIERARAHRETSIEGKWDPGYAPGVTLNMGLFRTEAAGLEEEDVALTEAEMNTIADKVYAKFMDTKIGRSSTDGDPAVSGEFPLRWLYASLDGHLGGIKARIDAVGKKVDALEASGVPVSVDYDSVKAAAKAALREGTDA